MHTILNVVSLIVGVSGLVAMLVYGPFAKTWWRTLLVPWALMFVHSALRVFCIISFREPCPPLAGYVVLPFMASAFSLVFRLMKVGLSDEIPALARLDERIRSRFSKPQIPGRSESLPDTGDELAKHRPAQRAS